MNTRAIQEQLAGLKQADLAAYRAGQRSNFVVNFIRNELIKRAAMADTTLATPIVIDFSMTAASYAIGALALLSKDGQYPALFAKSDMAFKDGEIKFTYTINGAGLSAEYREKLNDLLGINLPTVTEAVAV